MREKAAERTDGERSSLSWLIIRYCLVCKTSQPHSLNSSQSHSLTASQSQLLTVFEIAGSARVSAESGSESLSGSSADASGMRPYPEARHGFGDPVPRRWRVAEDVRGGGTLNVKPEISAPLASAAISEKPPCQRAGHPRLSPDSITKALFRINPVPAGRLGTTA